MSGLVDANGKKIPETVSGREIWRVTRPAQPGFRPETWLLLELEDGSVQFACETRGRCEARTPPIDFFGAGALAQRLVACEIPPSPGVLMMFATVLCAMHALATSPDPINGGQSAALNPEKDAA